MFDWRDEKIVIKVQKRVHLMEEPASPLLLHVVDAALVLLGPLHLLPLEHFHSLFVQLCN